MDFSPRELRQVLVFQDVTDDDLDQIQGNAEVLAGKLQERYGYAREEARRQADEFINQQSA